MPHSRPLPSLGPRCHELRVRDENHHWRVVYLIDSDAIVIAGVFAKTSPAQQRVEFAASKRRLSVYDRV